MIVYSISFSKNPCFQVQVTDLELIRTGVLDTSIVKQHKPWEVSANRSTLILNVRHEKELHVFRDKKYSHRVLYRFPDTLTRINLIPEDFFLCMSDYKLTVFDWDALHSQDFRWKLKLENPWNGYAYLSKKQMAVSTLKGRETVLQFTHMVPDKYRNFGKTVTGFLFLEFPCIPLCELNEDEIIVANIGRLDMLTKIKAVFWEKNSNSLAQLWFWILKKKQSNKRRWTHIFAHKTMFSSGPYFVHVICQCFLFIFFNLLVVYKPVYRRDSTEIPMIHSLKHATKLKNNQ